jgi:hypothetical protein
MKKKPLIMCLLVGLWLTLMFGGPLLGMQQPLAGILAVAAWIAVCLVGFRFRDKV